MTAKDRAREAAENCAQECTRAVMLAWDCKPRKNGSPGMGSVLVEYIEAAIQQATQPLVEALVMLEKSIDVCPNCTGIAGTHAKECYLPNLLKEHNHDTE